MSATTLSIHDKLKKKKIQEKDQLANEGMIGAPQELISTATTE